MRKTHLLIGISLCFIIGAIGSFAGGIIPILPSQTTQPDNSNTLHLCATGYIEVKVYDSVNTSSPIPTALVTLDYLNGTQIRQVYANGNGFANLTGLAPGWYYIHVSKVAYYSQNKTDYINWEGDDDYLSFYLQAMPAGSGYIVVTTRAAGSLTALTSTKVEVRNESGLIRSGYTNTSGMFKVSNLHVGWYDVYVEKAGYITQMKNDYINWNGDDDYLVYDLVAFPPGSGYIEVTVSNANTSAFINSAYVTVQNYTTWAVIHTGYTNVNGFFNVTGLYIGWYVINVSKAGYISQSKADYINWNGDDDYLAFSLQPYPDNSAYCRVTVKDPSLNPIENAYVYAINMETGLKHSAGFTNAAGIFNVTGCPKETWFQIIVQKDGYEQQLNYNYFNWNGDDDYLTFIMQPIDPDAQSLKVNVHYAKNHLVSIPNAEVVLIQSAMMIDTGSTGDWGSFTSTKVTNSSAITVQVNAAGYKSNTTVIDLLLMPYPNAEFTVYLDFLNATGYIEVMVYDSETNLPIENAQIKVKYPTGMEITYGTTNGAGFINITGLEVGWHDVTALKGGYITQLKYDYINWQGDDDYLTIYLVRISFVTQTLTLSPIIPNPDPTGDIDLTWNDVFWETGYKIYRGNSTGYLELIATLPANTVTYKDVGVTESCVDSNGNAFYQVIAINSTHTISSNIESVQVYSFGGGIPGFEAAFIVLTLAVVVVMFRWNRLKSKPNFLVNF